MTNSNDTAYPFYVSSDLQYLGLTKREYFAALAMQALIYHFGVRHDENAYESTKAADALINELNKKP